MIVIGIGPGKNGGMAAVDGRGMLRWYQKVGETEGDVWAQFVELKRFASIGPIHAFMEEVHSMPKQGVSSTFKFGRNYGMLRMALVACDVPRDFVSPSVWQGAMRCRTKGDKNVTKAKAQELFPTATVTHAVADAMLLAEYGRRVLVERGLIL